MAVKKPKSDKPLTPAERLFCAQYAENQQNGTRAYMAAFNLTNTNSAHVAASRLLQKATIRAEIDRITRAALKAAEMSVGEIVRDMSWMAGFDIAELSWQNGEVDHAGTVAHLRTNICPEECSPHVGIYKPVGEMSLRARKMIKAVKFDAQGRKYFELWSKESAQLNISKYHKLLVDKVEISNTISLADRIKAARQRAMAAARGKA